MNYTPIKSNPLLNLDKQATPNDAFNLIVSNMTKLKVKRAMVNLENRLQHWIDELIDLLSKDYNITLVNRKVIKPLRMVCLERRTQNELLQ